MATELEQLCDFLKRYHDNRYTPGVYEHSIMGKAALELEAQERRIAELEATLVHISSTENKVYRCLSFDIEYHSLINPSEAMKILVHNIERIFRRMSDGN